MANHIHTLILNIIDKKMFLPEFTLETALLHRVPAAILPHLFPRRSGLINNSMRRHPERPADVKIGFK